MFNYIIVVLFWHIYTSFFRNILFSFLKCKFISYIYIYSGMETTERFLLVSSAFVFLRVQAHLGVHKTNTRKRNPTEKMKSKLETIQNKQMNNESCPTRVFSNIHFVFFKYLLFVTLFFFLFFYIFISFSSFRNIRRNIPSTVQFLKFLSSS